MAVQDRRWIVGFAFTFLLFLLIAAATSRGGTDPFGIIMLLVVLATVGVLYALFPKRHLFAIGVTNFLAIYAVFYTYFVEANFPQLHHWASLVGFAVPVVTFVAGSWLKRDAINRIIAAEEPSEPHHWGTATLWVLPVAAVGILTFFVERLGLSPGMETLVFLCLMSAIGAIVLIVSEDVCSFLLQTSLLFEWFFDRMKILLVPAVAFFIFYTLLVIVFACIYRIVNLTDPSHFLVLGEPGVIDFSQSLYFSIVTLSTVGYGDIVPHSELVRILAAIQVLCGVLLMLFGFAEFNAYGRERAKRRSRDQA